MLRIRKKRGIRFAATVLMADLLTAHVNGRLAKDVLEMMVLPDLEYCG